MRKVWFIFLATCFNIPFSLKNPRQIPGKKWIPFLSVRLFFFYNERNLDKLPEKML